MRNKTVDENPNKNNKNSVKLQTKAKIWCIYYDRY